MFVPRSSLLWFCISQSSIGVFERVSLFPSLRHENLLMLQQQRSWKSNNRQSLMLLGTDYKTCGSNFLDISSSGVLNRHFSDFEGVPESVIARICPMDWR